MGRFRNINILSVQILQVCAVKSARVDDYGESASVHDVHVGMTYAVLKLPHSVGRFRDADILQVFAVKSTRVDDCGEFVMFM